jgi:large subunit ribosomal protein L9
MADTQIILKENVPGLGAEADIVKVRKGFARNHLIPTAKAYEVTASNLKRLNHLKGMRAEREARELNDAEDFSKKIGKLKLEFILETGDDPRYRREASNGIRYYDRSTQDRLGAADQREW